MKPLLIACAIVLFVTGCDRNAVLSSGKSPAPIPNVLKFGPIEEARELLGKSPELAKAADAAGSTPLHYATYNGNMELVELLISKGADPDVRNLNGQNALHRSVNSTNAAVTKLLIDEGLNINGRDNFGRTPLTMAILAGHPHIVKLLLDSKADPTVRNEMGMTAYHQAAGGTADLLAVILETKPNLNDRDKSGNTMLHYAGLLGQYPNVKLLVEAKADLTVTNVLGNNPLQVVESVHPPDRNPEHNKIEDYLREAMGLPAKERPAPKSKQKQKQKGQDSKSEKTEKQSSDEK